jgi:hypothetical protein
MGFSPCTRNVFPGAYTLLRRKARVREHFVAHIQPATLRLHIKIPRSIPRKPFQQRIEIRDVRVLDNYPSPAALILDVNFQSQGALQPL